MKLKNYHEIVGTLENYEEKEDSIELNFVFKQSVEIPKNAITIKDLEDCRQKNISILHLDEKYYLNKNYMG